MPGTKAGGQKARETNYKLHGRDFYSKIGRRGGLNGKGPGYKGGFAANPELAKIAGAIGGAKSRRKKMERDSKGKAIKKDGTHIKYTKPQPKPEPKKGFLKKIFGGK